jgi:hypothetical protein
LPGQKPRKEKKRRLLGIEGFLRYLQRSSQTTVIGTILEFSSSFVTILIVWDSIHGQDFQAPPACTNVLLATAKRNLPDSELGYNDSQKKLGNFSLPFVVRMKLVEIANYYYCPEKQTKQGVAGYLCASG